MLNNYYINIHDVPLEISYIKHGENINNGVKSYLTFKKKKFRSCKFKEGGKAHPFIESRCVLTLYMDGALSVPWKPSESVTGPSGRAVKQLRAHRLGRVCIGEVGLGAS